MVNMILGVEMPQGVAILLAFLGVLGIGNLVVEGFKRKFPTKKENQDISQAFINTTNEGIIIYKQLDEKLKAMVDQETQALNNVIMRRELEYAVQIKGYVTKIVDLQEKLEKAAVENNNLRQIEIANQNIIIGLQQKLEQEVVLKEKYLKELNDATTKIGTMEGRIKDLERQLGNQPKT